MKYLVLLLAILAVVQCQPPRCSPQNIQSRTERLFAVCENELEVAQTVADIDVPSFRNATCSQSCTAAVLIFNRALSGCADLFAIRNNSICYNSTRAGGNRTCKQLDFPPQRLSIIFNALRLVCTRNVQPTLGLALRNGGRRILCNNVTRNALRNAIATLDVDCGNVTSLADVCNPACLAKKRLVNNYLDKCREFPGILDEVFHAAVRVRLALVQEVCDRVSRANNVQFCQVLFAGGIETVGNTVASACAGDVCSARCKDTVLGGLNAVQRCVKLFEEQSNVSLRIPQPVKNLFRAARNLCRIRSRVIDFVVDSVAKRVVINAVDALSDVDARTRVSIIQGAKRVPRFFFERLVGNQVREKFTFKVRRIIEARTNRTLDAAGFDASLDETLNDWDLEAVAEDGVLEDLGDSPVRDGAGGNADAEINRYFRFAARVGLARLQFNFATTNRENGKAGLRVDAGGLQFSLVLRDAPRTVDGSFHVVVLDIESDRCDNINATDAAPEAEVDFGDEAPDVAPGADVEGRIDLGGSRQIRFRRRVFCEDDKFVDLRVRLVTVANPTGLEDGNACRARLYLTLKRSDNVSCYDYYLDPSSKIADEDNYQGQNSPAPGAAPTPGAAPAPGAAPTPGAAPAPGAAPGAAPTPGAAPAPGAAPTPAPSSAGSIIASLLFTLISFLL